GAWGRLADEQDTQIWELLAHQRCYSVHQPLSGICIRGVGQNALKENSRMFLPAAPVDSFADFRGDAVRWSVGVGNDHRVGESGTLKISGAGVDQHVGALRGLAVNAPPTGDNSVHVQAPYRGKFHAPIGLADREPALQKHVSQVVDINDRW